MPEKNYPVIKMPKTAFTTLMQKPKDAILTVDELACALYEGTQHLQGLAEKLARQHGQAGALSFFDMMGEDVQYFWRNIARQIINHSKQWQANQGSCCILSDAEHARLGNMRANDSYEKERDEIEQFFKTKKAGEK